MDHTLQQYDAVTAECIALFSKKAQDYGTAWRILRVPSLTDQIFIKAQRIRTLQTVGESKVGEGIRPELIGIINYAAMALVQLELGVVDSPDLSAEAATEKVLKALGMTPTEAIRLFYRQIAIRKAFPLELHVPNKLTASVLAKSDKNQDVESFDSAADLYASWDK
jgi:addiction module RelB/DinJ family antitoxin